MNTSIQSETRASAAAAPGRRSRPVQRFSDLDLQLCRRLDWRFLLRNSGLGNVAYLGEKKTSLAVALERFSDRLTFVSSAKFAKTPEVFAGSFDLAVVASATTSDFECAARVLKDGGWLYVEVGAAARFKAKFQGLNGYRTRLLCAGFRDVRAYWHRPSFAACREIVPLDDGLALDYVLSRQHQDFAGQIKSMAARFAMQTGLLPFVLPSVSLLACKYSEAGEPA